VGEGSERFGGKVAFEREEVSKNWNWERERGEYE